jgi:hypothetical protein
MSFSFGELVRFTERWLSSFRWTPRRAAVVVAFLLLYPLLELLIWTGLLLDNILFRGYRRQPLSAPVFIVGNFRSGTTFLHRLLSKDTERFTTMQMWEVLFSPSIAGRRIVAAVAAVIGTPVRWCLEQIERIWHEQNVMHEVSLTAPEEDDYLLLHIWSALSVGLSAGLLDEAEPYAFFDRALPEAERRRIMSFYRSCVQRHLFAHRKRSGPQYLAKNPALTPKLATLREHFPGAKVICLVRNPLEAIPSFVSMMEFSWQVMGAPSHGPELRQFLVRTARHWYSYPLELAANAPHGDYAIVDYERMIRAPEATVTEIYRRFGFDLSPAFAAKLRDVSERAGSYESRHRYDLESLGLSREGILEEFADIFERFGFDTGSE